MILTQKKFGVKIPSNESSNDLNQTQNIREDLTGKRISEIQADSIISEKIKVSMLDFKDSLVMTYNSNKFPEEKFSMIEYRSDIRAESDIKSMVSSQNLRKSVL